MKLPPLKFFRVLCDLVNAFRIGGGGSCFMHDKEKRSLQHRDYKPFFSATLCYQGRWIAIQICCDPNGDKKGKLFCRVLPHRAASSTNTQHVTLTNENVSTQGIYYVTPRLDKCGGRMRNLPRKIRGFPTQDSLRLRKFHVGPMGNLLLHRVLEVAIAKYDSI